MLTLIDHVDALGGAERLAVQLAIGLDPERFERHLCASRSPAEGQDSDVDSAIAELRAAGVTYHSLGRRHKLDVWRWAPFVSLLRRERIDVLHAHKFGSNLWGTITGRLARVPVVIAHEHSLNDPYSSHRLRRFLDRELIARFADVLVAVSRADQRHMIEVERIPPARTTFIPNGAPTVPAATDAAGRALLGVGSDTPTVGSVGYMHRRKRFDLLITAAAILRGEFPNLRMFIAGDGDERPALERLIATLSLGTMVRLLGRRSDVGELLGGLDVAVCSSDHEGSSIAVLEYMGAARPIVATRVGGTPDMITDGQEGLLVSAGDPVALAHAIGRLLRDRPLAARLGEAGRARREQEFMLETMCTRIGDLYLERLGRPPAAPDPEPAAAT